MEDYRKAVQINAVYVMCALAFLRIPLKHAGFCMEEGVLLVLQNTALFELVMSELSKYNTQKIRLRINGIINAENFHLVYTVYDQGYKTAVVHEFMDRTDFLPVIIVKGLVPPELRQFKNAVLIDDYNTSLKRLMTRTDDFPDFMEYVVENIDKIVEELKFLRKSKENAERHWHSDMPNAIGAVMKVICDYIHVKYRFNAADHRIDNELKKLCDEMTSVFYRADTDLDLADAVCRSMSNYLDRNKNILVGVEDQSEIEFWMAFEAHEAIVFDSDFYYMDEAVFKAGTHELHDVISINRLKMELYTMGVLICNVRNTEGYTVKKQFYKPDGTLLRLRVVKLSRARLDGLVQPDISMRRFTRCTSVCTEKNLST